MLCRYIWGDIQSWSQSRLATHIAIPSVQGQGEGEGEDGEGEGEEEDGEGEGEQGDREPSVELKQAPTQSAAQEVSRDLPKTDE